MLFIVSYKTESSFAIHECQQVGCVSNIYGVIPYPDYRS